MFLKLGESLEFNPQTNILSPQEALADEKIAKRFIKFAKKLKKLSPHSKNFTYFSSINILFRKTYWI